MIQIKGKAAEEIVENRKSETTLRVQWNFTSPEGISFQFDGIPFLCVGTTNYQCHQGNDVDLKTKIKRQKKQETNEVEGNKICMTINSNQPFHICLIRKSAYTFSKNQHIICFRIMIMHFERKESISSQQKNMVVQVRLQCLES